MTDNGGSGRPEGAAKGGRDQRLAERLRENLRRRKAQARARRQTAGSGSGGKGGDGRAGRDSSPADGE